MQLLQGVVTQRGWLSIVSQADGTALCLYTNGKTKDSEKVSVARIPMSWLQQAEVQVQAGVSGAGGAVPEGAEGGAAVNALSSKPRL